MIKRLLICCEREQITKASKKQRPERYRLSGVVTDKTRYKIEVYSMLLEIILSLTDENNEEGG